MSMPEQHTPRHWRPLAQDLFDALWLEDLYGFRGHCRTGREYWDVVLDAEGGRLRWFGRTAPGPRPLRLSARAALWIGDDGEQPLSVPEIATRLEQAIWWQATPGRLSEPFALACAQAAFAALHTPALLARLHAQPRQLEHWEALASLRDRPFHPLARGKPWSTTPWAREHFGVEAGHPIALHWVAVAREHWVASVAACATPAAHLLSPGQRDQLARHAVRRGIEPQAHEWLPLHPWQYQRWRRGDAGHHAHVLDLDFAMGGGPATASLRTLALPDRPALHLKLPLSAPLLGAIRTLPLRYLHNGVRAQQCLEALQRRDPWLAEHLQLCDERQWWALRQHPDVAQDPGEFACQLRRFPGIGDAILVPMAALPVVLDDGTLPALDVLLGTDASEDVAWTAFERSAALTLELGLRCFIQGAMPEMHGQNLLLAWREGQPVAAVLRDHDSLRVCPALLRSRGVPVPDYVIDPHSANNLEQDSPEQLLAYLQTLLLEVNLHALLGAIAERFDTPEAHAWQLLRRVIERVLARLDAPADLAGLMRHHLLFARQWPFKQVLRPLLEREGLRTGMPAAMSSCANPLLAGD